MNLQQTHKTDESEPRKPSKSSWTVLVRVGEETWHIGDESNSTEESTDSGSAGWEKAARDFQRRSKYSFRIGAALQTWLRRFRLSSENFFSSYFFGKHTAGVHQNSASRKFRDSLQLGVLVGLVLGCLSLILFHQMVPKYTAATGHTASLASHSGTPAASTSVVGTAPLDSPTLTIPALDVYTLKLGSYSSDKQARAVQQQLQHKGTWSVVVNIGHKYDVVTGTSMYNQSLQNTQQALKKKTGMTPSLLTLKSSVNQISALASLSATQSKEVSTWLTSVVSSLNTITAAVENNEPRRDANTTYASALKLTPAPDILKKALSGTQLLAVENQWKSAYKAFAHKQNTAAQKDSLSAYVDLIRLHGHP